MAQDSAATRAKIEDCRLGQWPIGPPQQRVPESPVIGAAALDEPVDVARADAVTIPERRDRPLLSRAEAIPSNPEGVPCADGGEQCFLDNLIHAMSDLIVC